MMKLEMKALSEERLKHDHQIVPTSAAGGLRLNIVPVFIDPLRPAEDQRLWNIVGTSDAALERNVLPNDTARPFRDSAYTSRSGITGLDTRNFKCRLL